MVRAVLADNWNAITISFFTLWPRPTDEASLGLHLELKTGVSPGRDESQQVCGKAKQQPDGYRGRRGWEELEGLPCSLRSPHGPTLLLLLLVCRPSV